MTVLEDFQYRQMLEQFPLPRVFLFEQQQLLHQLLENCLLVFTSVPEDKTIVALLL